MRWENCNRFLNRVSEAPKCWSPINFIKSNKPKWRLLQLLGDTNNGYVQKRTINDDQRRVNGLAGIKAKNGNEAELKANE